MPPLDPGNLLSLLGHPLSIALLSLLAAAAASMLVGAQLRAIGLDRPPQGGRLRWSTAFAVAGFWGTLLLGLHVAASKAQLPHVPGLIQDALGTLMMLAPAGLILAGASHFRAQYIRDAADRRDLDESAARRHGDIGLALAGVLAALGLMGQGFGSFLLAMGLCAAAYQLFRSPDSRARLAEAYEDFIAGLTLRERALSAGDQLEAEGRRVEHLGVIGLLSSWVREDGVEKRIQNRELLTLTKPRQLHDKGGAPPR